MVISADHRRIDVTVFVDLRAAHEADVDVAALEVVYKDIVHAYYRERAADEGGIANRKWQARGLRSDHAGFVDHHQVWCVRPFGEVTGTVWLPNADKDHIAIPQQARGVDDHQFGGRIIDVVHKLLFKPEMSL